MVDAGFSFGVTFVRALADLRVVSEARSERTVPARRVFLCSQSIAAGAWRRGLVEPAGAPGDDAAEVVFALNRGGERDALSSWRKCDGEPYNTTTPTFAVSVEAAPPRQPPAARWPKLPPQPTAKHEPPVPEEFR